MIGIKALASLRGRGCLLLVDRWADPDRNRICPCFSGGGSGWRDLVAQVVAGHFQRSIGCGRHRLTSWETGMRSEIVEPRSWDSTVFDTQWQNCWNPWTICSYRVGVCYGCQLVEMANVKINSIVNLFQLQAIDLDHLLQTSVSSTISAGV